MSKLMDVLQSDEFIKAHQKWLDDPITRTIKEIADEFGTSRPLEPVDGENALYQCGVKYGRDSLLAVMFDIARLADEMRQARRQAEALSPSMRGGEVDAELNKQRRESGLPEL